MLHKKVPLYTTLLFLTSTCVFGILWYQEFSLRKAQATENNRSLAESFSCNYKLTRLAGFTYTHPLMYAEPACESPVLSGAKAGVDQLIREYKSQGLINAASVYLREFNSGEWISIGDEKKYSPGSLLKIPELIAFYKMNEARPGWLDKKLTFTTPFETTKQTHFVSKSIELGKSYSIRELLRYMIEYSDNNATNLLNQQIDVDIFKKVFTDLGLALPDWKSSDYPMTAQDFSVFMKVLYNASYLNVRDSESCLQLLANSDFKDGIRAGVPQECRIVHKFGEGGPNNNPDLSESAIVFSPSGNYMLTIMVNGREMQKLPQAISGLSRIVYQQMCSIQGSKM